jgi:hypothetical protein
MNRRPQILIIFSSISLFYSFSFLPENFARLLADTSYRLNPWLGTEVTSKKEYGIISGLYGLGNLPPYSSVQGINKSVLLIGYTLISSFIVFSFVLLLQRRKPVDNRGRGNLSILVFLLSTFVVGTTFAVVYARNATYTYAKASYYIYPLLIYIIAISMMQVGKKLMIPIALVFVLTASSMTLSFFNSISNNQERAAVGTSELSKLMETIPANSQVLFFPKKDTPAHVAIIELYLFKTRVLVMYGDRSKSGYELKMIRDDFFVIEELQNELKVSNLSCIPTLECKNKTFTPVTSQFPEVYLDYSRKIVKLK